MTDKNQGEGNKAAAKRFNKKQQDFVESDAGQEEIQGDHAAPEKSNEKFKAELRKAASLVDK